MVGSYLCARVENSVHGEKETVGEKNVRGKNERNRWQSRPSDGGRIISATFLGKGDPVSHGTGG